MIKSAQFVAVLSIRYLKLAELCTGKWSELFQY